MAKRQIAVSSAGFAAVAEKLQGQAMGVVFAERALANGLWRGVVDPVGIGNLRNGASRIIEICDTLSDMLADEISQERVS